jgi:phosphohistidine swiveling domain-containing protein
VVAPETPFELGALREKFDEAVETGTALGAAAIGCSVAELPSTAFQLLGRVAGGALDVLDGLHAVDSTSALGVLSVFDATGRALATTGALAHREQIWGLSAADVRTMLELPSPGRWHGQRHRILRWQPIVQAAIRVQGHRCAGDGVSPGAGAGLARRISSSADLRRVVPGDVVVVRRPSPQLAPALWVAAGLVAESGSGAAHLVEVARSLRVPAVVAVGPFAAADGEDLVLVDGDRQEAAVLHAPRHGPSRVVAQGLGR